MTAAVLAALVAVAVLVVGAAPQASAALPNLRDSYGAAIESPPPYQAQTTCLTSVQPGTRDLAALLEASFPATFPSIYVRSCGQGATSEHKEGRAIDWMVDSTNPAQAAAAEQFIAWITATDRYGNKDAMARRLGIMYIIWKGRLLRLYAGGHDAWVPNTGHYDHVHISLGWDGARRLTSYWTKTVTGSVVATPGGETSGTTGTSPQIDDVVYRPATGSTSKSVRHSVSAVQAGHRTTTSTHTTHSTSGTSSRRTTSSHPSTPRTTHPSSRRSSHSSHDWSGSTRRRSSEHATWGRDRWSGDSRRWSTGSHGDRRSSSRGYGHGSRHGGGRGSRHGGGHHG